MASYGRALGSGPDLGNMAVSMKNCLKDLRKDRGWSQQTLAEKAGVSRQTIIAIEKGKYDPSLPLAFVFSKVFGLPIEQIFQPDCQTDCQPN